MANRTPRTPTEPARRSRAAAARRRPTAPPPQRGQAGNRVRADGAARAGAGYPAGRAKRHAREVLVDEPPRSL